MCLSDVSQGLSLTHFNITAVFLVWNVSVLKAIPTLQYSNLRHGATNRTNQLVVYRIPWRTNVFMLLFTIFAMILVEKVDLCIHYWMKTCNTVNQRQS